MKYYVEKSLSNFKFWSGAVENAAELTEEQFDTLEASLEDAYPEGMSDTEINDLFWFEFDTIKEWLGINEESEEEFDLGAALEVAAEDGYDKIRQFFIDKFANGQNPEFYLDWEELYNEEETDWYISDDFKFHIEASKGNVDTYEVTIEMGAGKEYDPEIDGLCQSMSTYDHNEGGMVLAVQDCMKSLIAELKETLNKK